MKANLKKIFGGNYGIWLILLGLFMYSILAVYSASVQLPGTDTTRHLFKHAAGLLGAGICIYIVHRIPCIYFRKVSSIFYVLSIVLLIVTWLFAPEVNGAKRWLMIGPISLQTSDIAKVALIMFLANKLSKKDGEINSLKDFAKLVLLPIGLTCLLIMPSNLSTALLVFFEALVLVFFSSVNRKYFWSFVGISVLAGGLLFATILYGNITIWRFPTWKARVESWVAGDKSDSDQVQVNNARVAVASGGLIGRGPGNGHAKIKLANAHCDYIFANIVEEVGIIFSAFLIWLYIMLFARAISIVNKINKLEPEEALKPKYKFRQYLVLGLTSMIVIQAFSNMAVSTDLMPVTGQTLPFVSYGTSSLVFIGFAMGVILSVSREVDKDTEKIAAETEADSEVKLVDGKIDQMSEEANNDVAVDDNSVDSPVENVEMDNEIIEENDLNIEENERK